MSGARRDWLGGDGVVICVGVVGLSGVRGEWGSRHPDLDFSRAASGFAQSQRTQPLHRSQQDRHPVVVLHDAVDHLPPRADDQFTRFFEDEGVTG